MFCRFVAARARLIAVSSLFASMNGWVCTTGKPAVGAAARGTAAGALQCILRAAKCMAHTCSAQWDGLAAIAATVAMSPLVASGPHVTAR